ncbi:uncharacterized protein LOC143894208 isoform X1 [Temnothorax americanus]|uniref:uncharacterized protein LOC143894208 isoform X1 n=1 Tax=Temnothorax americanus TaxID=1964332 RepID=UPI004068CC74
MQRVCTKCKRTVATTLVECKCMRVFHPGCIKPYSITKYAEDCCRSLSASSDLPLTPEVDNTVRSLNFDIMTTPASAGAQSQSQLQSQCDNTTNSLLLCLTEQLSESNAKLTEQLMESNARFSAFVEEQRRTNNELNDKLDKLNCIAGSVERNSQRTVELEQRCNALADEIRDMKSDCAGSHSDVYVQSANELIVWGVPAAMSITPSECVRNVFATLEIPELSCHVLDVRAITRKPLPVAASDRPLPISATNSYIVTLASGAVRDLVMSKKRARRTLTQKNVCGNGSDRNVLVNEMLPKDAYELLQQTKRVAKDKSYAYAWVRRGRVHTSDFLMACRLFSLTLLLILISSFDMPVPITLHCPQLRIAAQFLSLPSFLSVLLNLTLISFVDISTCLHMELDNISFLV